MENTEVTQEITETPEVDEAQSILPPESPAAAAAASPAEEEAPVSPATPETPEYVPNFKFNYSAFGKQGPQEGEFDEKLKALVKDPDTEKLVRDLYESRLGIEHMYKPRHEKMKSELTNFQKVIETEHKPLVAALTEVAKARDQGDLETVFEKLNISKKSIYQWVADDLKYQEMTPEQQAEVSRNRQAQARARQGDDAVASLQSTVNQQAVAMRNLELDMALSSPEVRTVQEAVDAKHGPGTFRNQVIREGFFHAAQTQQDMPVPDAVKKVVQFFGPSTQAETPTAQPTAPQAPAKKPVLPSFSGRSGSPAKKIPSSLEDLKKMAKEAQQTA